jgi:hypothetical protein
VISRVAYGHERVVLERYGRDLIALVPLEDLKLLEALEDRADIEVARAARAEVDTEGTISLEDLKKELEL